jgi:hypothetical protein
VIPGVPPLKVIETITLGSDAATQRIPASGTIADIAPAGSRHLVVMVNGHGASRTTHRCQFNGDTDDNYLGQRMYGSGTSLVADLNTDNGFVFGDMPTATNQASGGVLLVPHYANDYGHKAGLSIGGENELNVFVIAGRWTNVAEITYATVMTGGGGDMTAGTVITLAVVDETYAIAGAEQILTSDAAMNTVTLPDVAGDISFIGYLRSAKSANAEAWNMTLNGDTTATNYNQQVFQADGTTASGWVTTGGSLEIAYQAADNSTANVFGPYLGNISQHADGDNHAHVLTFGGFHTAEGTNIRMYSKRWANTAAVTSLLINPVDGTAEDGTMMSYYSSIPKVLLARTAITGDTGSVTFTLSGLAVPANVKSLRLHWYARTDKAAVAEGLLLHFNGDSTETNYHRQEIIALSTTVIASAPNDASVGATTSNTATANVFSSGTVLIPEYAGTTYHKARLQMGGRIAANTSSMQAHSGRWVNTAAITSLTLVPSDGNNFVAGSFFELEGIGDAGWTGTINGVANPGKVMGVEAVNIVKVNGVA